MGETNTGVKPKEQQQPQEKNGIEHWNVYKETEEKSVCARAASARMNEKCVCEKKATRDTKLCRVLTIWHFVHVYTSTIVAVSSGYRYIFILLL